MVKEEDDYYTQIYQDSNVEIDESGKILTEYDGIIYTINEWACSTRSRLARIMSATQCRALLNGESVNLIVLYDEASIRQKGHRRPARLRCHNGHAPKQLIKIKDGDVITPFTMLKNSTMWMIRLSKKNPARTT